MSGDFSSAGGGHDAKYLPTPEEILEKCAEIRRTWSEQTHIARATSESSDHPRWRPPLARICDLAVGRAAIE